MREGEGGSRQQHSKARGRRRRRRRGAARCVHSRRASLPNAPTPPTPTHPYTHTRTLTHHPRTPTHHPEHAHARGVRAGRRGCSDGGHQPVGYVWGCKVPNKWMEWLGCQVDRRLFVQLHGARARRGGWRRGGWRRGWRTLPSPLPGGAHAPAPVAAPPPPPPAPPPGVWPVFLDAASGTAGPLLLVFARIGVWLCGRAGEPLENRRERGYADRAAVSQAHGGACVGRMCVCGRSGSGRAVLGRR